MSSAAPEAGQDRADDSTIMVAKAATPVPPPTPPVTARAVPPAPPVPAAPTPPPPPVYGGYGPPGIPPKKSRLGMWIGIGVAAAIVIAAAVAIPLLLLDKGDESATNGTTRTTATPTSQTTTTTGSSTTDSSPASSSTSTSATTTSTSTTTTTAAPAGDSDGAWVEIDVPQVPEGTYALSLSEQVLLVESNSDAGFALHTYVFDTGELLELPLEGGAPPTADLDGPVAVWQEAQYDRDTDEPYDQRICAYIVPSREKIQIAATGTDYAYPQVALPWVTWTESEPWESNPEEYFAKHIYAVELDSEGHPKDLGKEWVSTAPAYMYGDLGWIYSLSSTHLAWENHAPHHLLDMGTYVFEIGSESEPVRLGQESWRPSLAGDHAVYWDTSLRFVDLGTMQAGSLDPQGDFATAGPTYAAYYRTVQSGDSYYYEIVARGYTGEYEQVLVETDVDPYFLAPIATSESYVAFVIDGAVRLFEWQGR